MLATVGGSVGPSYGGAPPRDGGRDYANARLHKRSGSRIRSTMQSLCSHHRSTDRLFAHTTWLLSLTSQSYTATSAPLAPRVVAACVQPVSSPAGQKYPCALRSELLGQRVTDTHRCAGDHYCLVRYIIHWTSNLPCLRVHVCLKCFHRSPHVCGRRVRGPSWARRSRENGPITSPSEPWTMDSQNRAVRPVLRTAVLGDDPILAVGDGALHFWKAPTRRLPADEGAGAVGSTSRRLPRLRSRSRHIRACWRR